MKRVMVAAAFMTLYARGADATVFRVTTSGTITSRYTDSVSGDPVEGLSYRLSVLLDTSAATITSVNSLYGPTMYKIVSSSFDYDVGSWTMREEEKGNFLLTLTITNYPAGSGHDSVSLSLAASPLMNGAPAIHGASTPFDFGPNDPLEYEYISANFTDSLGLNLDGAGIAPIQIGMQVGQSSEFTNSVSGPLPSPRPFMGQVGFSSNNAILSIGEVIALPEPATWAMFIGGFGLVGGAMRRRQRVRDRLA